MKNNQLILLDMLIGFILLPLCIFVRFLRRLVNKLFPVRYEGILLIKFLGAGNFLAIKNVIDGKNIDIVTAKSNLGVINNFSIGKRAYIIDDSSILRLVLTSSICCIKLFFNNYHQVINLETESKFAKFLTAMTSAEILSGVTNVHKSYIDYWLYDRYIVNPLVLSKASLIAQLEGFHPVSNDHIQSAILRHRDCFEEKNVLRGIARITISPTCSNTDHLRRLSQASWLKILDILTRNDGVMQVDAIFPSVDDPQFQYFVEMQKSYPILTIKVTSYTDYINQIKSTDLLLTVDSQALHLRQQFNKVAIAIYGPTSPFGVNLTNTTYPVTKSLVCSPCTHKYLRLPCGDLAPCMDFDDNDFSILRKINQ